MALSGGGQLFVQLRTDTLFFFPLFVKDFSRSLQFTVQLISLARELLLLGAELMELFEQPVPLSGKLGVLTMELFQFSGQLLAELIFLLGIGLHLGESLAQLVPLADALGVMTLELFQLTGQLLTLTIILLGIRQQLLQMVGQVISFPLERFMLCAEFF